MVCTSLEVGVPTCHEEVLESLFFDASNRRQSEWLTAALLSSYRDMEAGKQLILVAREAGHTIGIVEILFQPPDDCGEERRSLLFGDNVVNFENFGVRPNRRRLGIGSQLLRAAEKVSLEGGNNIATIAPYSSNRGAQRLYSRRGYSVIKEFRQGHYPSQTAMRKVLHS